MSADDPNAKPLSRTMQRHILATFVQQPHIFAQCRPFLKPEYFSDEPVSDIVAWTINQWDTHREVPSKPAMMDAFDEPSRQLVIKKAYADDVRDVKLTVDRIRDYARNRAMRAAIRRAAEVMKAQETGEPLLDEKGRPLKPTQIPDPVALVREAAAVGGSTADQGYFLDEKLDEILKRIENPRKVDIIPTGMEHLDNAGTVLEAGEVGCVLAATKRGKSHVLLNIAFNNLIAGRHVLYYNIEMPEERLEDRWVRRIGGAQADQKQDPATFVAKVKKRFPKLTGRLMLKRFFSKQTTFNDIRAHMINARAVHGFRPTLVIVDYVGILKPAERYDEMRFTLANLWLEFRSFCQEFGVAGWSAAQVNRAGTNKSDKSADELVTMVDIAESFEIIQHIDAGFSISMSRDELNEGTGRFFVFASRNEQDGAIVRFNHDYYRSLIRTQGYVEEKAEEKGKGKGKGKGKKATTEEDRADAQFHKAAAERAKEKAGNGDHRV